MIGLPSTATSSRTPVCRHLEVSSSTLALMATPSSCRTNVQRSEDAPLLQQSKLLSMLQNDWQHTLNTKVGLRARLTHHCCVCNQWFAKGHHMTHHGHRQHRSLFAQGRLHRNEIMLQSGIGAIKMELSILSSCFSECQRASLSRSSANCGSAFCAFCL